MIDIDANTVKIAGAADPTGFNVSGVFSQSLTFGVVDGGDGGNIDIEAHDRVDIEAGGRVSARSDGTGDAGDIRVAAGKKVRILDGGEILTEALGSSGGNIEVLAGDYVRLELGRIETDVLASGAGENAGDVTVEAESAVLDRSHIIANAFGGADAGNITIAANHTFLSGESFLQATADIGIDGTVEITSPVTDLTGALTTLPARYLDASEQLARECAARTARAGSFTVRSRPAIDAPPDASVPLAPVECAEEEDG
jgi:hypothetical protein